MPHIDVNFVETPDSMPPIPAGVFLLDITSIPKVEPSKKGDSMNVIVELKLVSDDALFNGRLLRDYINLGSNPEMKLRADIKLKKLCASAGLVVGAAGVDTEELAGKRVKARLKPRTYKDDSGNEQQGTSVEEYLKA